MDNAHEHRARRRMGAWGETLFPLTRRGRASPLHVTQPGTGVRCPATRTGDINTGPNRNPGVGRHQDGPSGGTTHAGPRSDHRRGISVPRTGHPPQWGGIPCGRPRTHTTRPTCPYPLQRICHPRTNDELLQNSDETKGANNMLKRYIRWILPLLVLTLIVAAMIVTHGAFAHAAAPHIYQYMWHS